MASGAKGYKEQAIDAVRKATVPMILGLVGALFLAAPRTTSVSLAGPDPEGSPTPATVVPTSATVGPQVLIKTAQWGVPSALLEWEGSQLCQEEGGYSFAGFSPVPFTHLSVGWLATERDVDPASFGIAIRTRKDKAPWTEWVRTQGDIGPDDSPSRLFWSRLYIPSDFDAHTEFDVRMRAPGEVSLTFVRISVADTTAGLKLSGLTERPVEEQLATTNPAVGPFGLYVIPRSVWWGDLPAGELDSPRWPPSYRDITHALLHHTVTENNPPNPAQVVRSIWMYHAYDRGWGDIGYNFLVDHFGNIYEGRYNAEPDTKDVIGAHAAGYNAGSMGVALMGQFHPPCAPPECPQAGWPTASALRSTESLLAWGFRRRNLDPLGQATLVDKFIYRIAGHRDVGLTSCPGDRLYAQLPTIRANVHTAIGLCHTLTVNSLQPDSGVPIEVSPKDGQGRADGVTPFTRIYNHDAVVTLEAPSTVGHNRFHRWQINGMDYASISYVCVTMIDGYTMTAVYEQAQPALVSISMKPVSTTVPLGRISTLAIEVDAGEQPIDRAEVHIDFDPVYLRVVNADGIEVGAIKEVTTSLDTVLQNVADNSRGTIDYAAEVSAGERPSDTITLALVPLRALTETVATRLSFVFAVPRKTDVAVEGVSILGDHTDGYVSIMACQSTLHLPIARRDGATGRQ